MLKNYFRTSARYLAKNKAYALINVLGLAVGMACFILLTIFVKQEFSYDEFHTKKDQIYQVFLADSTRFEDGYNDATQGPAGPLLAAEIPEITNYARLMKETEKVVKVNNQRFLARGIIYADDRLFQMFDFPLWSSKNQDFEMEINEVLISEQEAIKLFGSAEAAIGQTLEMVAVGGLLVKDVFLDLPENTHLDFDYVIAFQGVQKAFSAWSKKSVFEWGFVSAFKLYIELADGEIAAADLEPKIRETMLPHRSDYAKLIAVSDIYFAEENKYGKKGNKDYAQLYLGVAFLILIIASVNYMNLATARLTKRSKEVGIRKTIGGNRGQIIRQFLMESMLISLTAMVLSVCLAEMSLPFLKDLIGKPLTINYSDPAVLSFILLAGATVGLVSGLYPALYLSKFNPVQALTRNLKKGKSQFSFRQVLVGFQFFACLGLMSVTLIVFKQFEHMQKLDKGLDDQQVISVPLIDKGVQKDYGAFKARLSQIPAVKEVTGTTGHIFSRTTTFFVEPEGTKGDQPIILMGVEKNFITNMGIELAEGTDFNQLNDDLNTGKILINKAAQEKFNWVEPIGKKILSYVVTGVTDDFLYGSAKEAIEPLMIVTKASEFRHAYIRVSTADMGGTLSSIEKTFDGLAESYPFEYSFLDEDFARKYDKEQRLSNVFTVFSILAIFVAGLGILGLSMYIAEQRTKEIGIRRVLGAKVGNILWLLNKNTTVLVAIVAVIVLPAVHYFMSSWVDGFANRIHLGFMIYLLPLVGLMSLVWLILLNQSFKSARQNPINALRTE